MSAHAALDPGVSWRNATSAASRVIVAELTPPEDLLPSQWAEQFRHLPETSAASGPWSNEVTPYLVGIMDACVEPGVERVSWQKPAQVGGSEAGNNIIGYFMHQDPSPILYVHTNDKEAKAYSKERIAKMIDASPVLRNRVDAAGGDDTTLSKDFTGGHLAIAGANAPAGLRSRARRVLILDEVDGYPASAGNEGDPVSLATARTTTFWNRLIMDFSTPTLEGLSRIEASITDADEVRCYLVPCPHCAHYQRLRFGNLQWEKDPEGNHLTDTVEYRCESCSALIPERQKRWMNANGEWVPHRKAKDGEDDPDQGEEWRGENWVPCEAHPHPKHIGFAGFSALYSPWLTWQEVVDKFLKAKGNPVRLQVWVNTVLGETFREGGYQLDAHPLLRRREVYPATPVPDGVMLITAGVDVQADRLEVEIVGWGENQESWSLDFMRILGDPSVEGGVWHTLDQQIARKFRHPAGVELSVFATAVDSGYLTQTVYRYCKERWQNNVWAVKGVAGFGRVIWSQPTNKNKFKTNVFSVGVDTAKTSFYSHLRIQKPEDYTGGPIPGYCHYPAREPYDEEYFRQITSEKAVVRLDKRGVMQRIWIRRPNRRADSLDCRIYAFAAHEGAIIQGIRMEALRQAIDAGGMTHGGRRVRRYGEAVG